MCCISAAGFNKIRKRGKEKASGSARKMSRVIKLVITFGARGWDFLLKAKSIHIQCLRQFKLRPNRGIDSFSPA